MRSVMEIGSDGGVRGCMFVLDDGVRIATLAVGDTSSAGGM